jgi:hypothetical protein
MVMKAMGRRELLDEVTEYEPGRRIAHRSVAGPMAIHTACIVEPAGNGCRATVLYEPSASSRRRRKQHSRQTGSTGAVCPV